MITKELFEKLDPEEQKLWHSHEVSQVFYTHNTWSRLPHPNLALKFISFVLGSSSFETQFEVKSGMLILPTPPSHTSKEAEAEWERLETQAMREVVGLYGKTWHFWQVDRGDELPLGMPRLMGSLTAEGQADLEVVMKERNERYGVDMPKKRKLRENIATPGVVGNTDSWWRGMELSGLR